MANNFHKRHYERVAEAIQEAKREAAAGDNTLAAFAAIDLVVEELVCVFRGDNSSFKRERFIAACVPGANVRARS